MKMKNKNLTKNQLLFKYNLDTLFWINRPKQDVIDFIEWREAKKKFSLISWIKEKICL